MPRVNFMLALILILAFASFNSMAADDNTPEFTIVIKGHKFQPTELTIPADTKVKLIVDNQDATPEEFESHELNREKIIPSNDQVKIFVGPLKPGVYPFYGEFNQATAQGKLTVK